MSEERKPSGLAGVVAGITAISTVGKEGVGLTYRGYMIEDLAENATFEEVAYLILFGELPGKAALDEFSTCLRNGRSLPSALTEVLERVPPKAHPMDVLRTACSMLGTLEPEGDFSRERTTAVRLLGIFPAALAYWHRFHRDGIRLDATRDGELGFAAFFLKALLGKRIDEECERALDVSFILYAEHEFNASTFATRITASTLSDIHSAITTGIGTLRGPLHGGANEAAMDLIQKFEAPNQAEQGILEMLRKKELIMGFGHRVYKHADPRSDIIQKWAQRLARTENEKRLYAVAERIEAVMRREKGLFPNLDFYSALVYHFCEIATPLFSPLFVLARTSGWSAHVFEQRANNRLIRPTAEYTGPAPRKFVPIQNRS